MMTINSVKNLVVGATPSLSGGTTWFTGEVQIAVGLIALAIFVFFLVKQKIGPAVGVLLAAAFVFFMAGDPSKVMTSLGEIFKLIFG